MPSPHSRVGRLTPSSPTWSRPSRSRMTTRGTGPGENLEPAGPAGSPPPREGRGSKMLGGRAVLVSSASTILFFAAIAAIVVLAPGSEVVAERFFSPFHLKQSFLGTQSEPSVVGAFLLNVEIFMVSEVLILILALGYTDLFRGVPLMLVLYMFGFGVPGLCLGTVSYLPDVTYGIIALVLVYSAYVDEVYRAGIESVHESQTAAARSLGLTRWQSMRFVILPQAVRRIIPPLLNDFI